MSPAATTVTVTSALAMCAGMLAYAVNMTIDAIATITGLALNRVPPRPPKARLARTLPTSRARSGVRNTEPEK